MSDNRTLQEQCYGVCWAAQQRIEELENELISANNHIKRLEDIIREAARVVRRDEDDISTLGEATESVPSGRQGT